jgi:transcriptional regulator with XRE-family HTH domain
MAAAATFRDQLVELEAVVGSRRQVARLLGVHHGRISAWLGSSRPRAAALRRIADAAAAVEALAARGGSSPDAIVSLLEAPWDELNGARPSELIAAGRAAEVTAAVRRSARSRGGRKLSVEHELVDALITLASAARASADALTSAQLGVAE